MPNVNTSRLSSFSYISLNNVEFVTPNPVFAIIRFRKFFRRNSPVICKIYVP